MVGDRCRVEERARPRLAVTTLVAAVLFGQTYREGVALLPIEDVAASGEAVASKDAAALDNAGPEAQDVVGGGS